MYSYSLLEPRCFYLIQEKPDTAVTVIEVTVETDHCVYIKKYGQVLEYDWKKKSDTMHDIIECMTDEKVKEFMTVFYEGWDAYEEEDE